jgi:hypothetical protein
MSHFSATYSPEDNKLRLYSVSRLDAALYERVKAAGFSFAPKQDLFVAPMWTPAREDLLLELCGEIDDEDTSLVERAEARAVRFDGYSERRGQEADAARRAVDSIADNIPFGQPILVGHHSERRARKDAERIENGMRRAVKLWETSEYWERRAEGALRHAKYLERADVRHRRIKRIESERRKCERQLNEAQKFLAGWQKEGLDMERAKVLAGNSHLYRKFPLADYPRNPPASQYEGDMGIWSALDEGIINETQARDMCVPAYRRSIERNQRWIAHYDNRLIYERAMLGEQGGIAADRFDIVPGGRVKVRGDWAKVVRVNRKDGKIVSVSTDARFVSVRGIEEIQDYMPPTEEEAAKMTAATKLPPMCNYPGEGFGQITKKQWDDIYKDYKASERIAATETAGAHRVRKVLGCYAFPDEQDWNKRHRYVPVYLTDSKRIDPPAGLKAAA